MKKIILLSVFIATISAAHSQYFTVKLGGGYSMPGLQNSGSVLTFQPGVNPDPANAQIIALSNFDTAATSAGNRNIKNLYAGYSQGGHFDFSFGYMINPYFGVQLDGAYLWGSTITASQTYDDPLLGKNANIVTTTHSNGLSINPSLYFRAAKPSSKWAPYARVGIALPIAGSINHNLAITSNNTNIFAAPLTADIGVKTTANVSVGFQGSVGVSYTPVPLISVWVEVQGQYLLVRAKQAVLTEYILNIQGQQSQNMLTTNNIINNHQAYSTYSQVINFVDVLTPNSNTTAFGKSRVGAPGTTFVNENAAHDELRQVANLAALGFAVGVTFNMSKKIFQDPFGKKAKASAAPKS